MATVPKKTLNTLMNALSNGVVPRRGLEYIAVGRKKETQTFVNDLEFTAEGGGAFRFISGRFGNGKSFMTQMIRNYAMDKGFVVMDADLAIDRRLTGSKKEGLNTYRELIKNTAYRTRPEGGAMEPILQMWIEDTIQAVSEKKNIDRDDVEDRDIENEVREATREMAFMQYYQDFIKAVIAYFKDYRNDVEDSAALRWLKGELETKNSVRKDVGINLMIDDNNWYDIIKLWTHLLVGLGYKGLVIFLDEAVVLYKLQNKMSRSNNYERILTMFNDIIQGKSSYLSMYVCGTPEFIEDPNRGLYSYEALRSRLTKGKFENGYDNYLGPVINLRPLTNEEIFVLLKTLRSLHEQKYSYETGISDKMLENYLKAVLANSISSEMITPREITRDLISLLDTLHQNPNAKFENMISGRALTADSDTDGDIIEDLDL